MAQETVEAERRWTVGELARASGLTVRALHHYDHIGLLTPSSRTPAGHRRYGAADVGRLYRIVALRQLGVRLEDMPAWLQGGVDGESLRRHLAAV